MKIIDEAAINLVSNYGVLAIIGLLFLKDWFTNHAFNKKFNERVDDLNKIFIEQFERMFTSRQKEQDITLENIEKNLDTIRESLFSHNIRSQQSITEVTAELDKILDYRMDIKSFLEKHGDALDEYYDDYKSNLNLLKNQVVRLREIIVSIVGQTEIIDKLIEEGKITRADIKEATSQIAKKNVEDEL